MALTLLHADTFNRSDRTLDSDTMSDGVGAWAEHSAGSLNVTITSNTARNSAERVVVDSVMSGSETDQKAEAVFTGADSGVICRWVAGGGGIGNFYLAYVGSFGGSATLYYRDGTGFHSISSGGTIASGDVVSVEAVGTTIRVLQNGSQIISATDSSAASGSCGIYVGGAGSSILDDFADYVDAGASFSTALFRSNAGVGAAGGGPFARANAGVGAL